MHNFSKLQGCGSKIGSATPIWISKFKRAWQTQFLSHNLETLEKWVFFEDIQMILVSFFHIPIGFQLRKNAFKSSVHILRRPWLIMQDTYKNIVFIKFLKKCIIAGQSFSWIALPIYKWKRFNDIQSNTDKYIYLKERSWKYLWYL